MRSLYFLMLGALTACTVGPDYLPAVFDAPEQWQSKAPHGEPAMASTQPWWENLHDPVLNALEAEALRANENRKIAQARILEVRGNRKTAQGMALPSIGMQTTAAKYSDGFLSGGGDMTTYHAGFDASYELDLFGGNQRAIEAQDALIGAREADYRSISLTLTAEVATEYVHYRLWQHQQALASQTAKARKHIAAIASNRVSTGIAGSLERDEAESLALSSAAQVTEYTRLMNASEHALAVLLGKTPDQMPGLLKSTTAFPDANVMPLLSSPAEVIRRRPDIAEAERELAAATAMQGVAISRLYPKISLSALFGLQYSNIPGVFFNNDANWLMGSAITMPVLEFGTIEGQIQAADARQLQAMHRYRQAVITALAEVETALSNMVQEQTRLVQLRHATEAAQKAVATARQNYRAGLKDFTTVLTAEEQSYSMEQQYAASQAQQIQYLVALYKATSSPIPEQTDATETSSTTGDIHVD